MPPSTTLETPSAAATICSAPNPNLPQFTLDTRVRRWMERAAKVYGYDNVEQAAASPDAMLVLDLAMYIQDEVHTGERTTMERAQQAIADEERTDLSLLEKVLLALMVVLLAVMFAIR